MSFYPYIVSSLFRLEFEKEPPYSFEEFLDFCKRFISLKEYRALQKLPLIWESLDNQLDSSVIFRKWQGFNIALRNALVELRAEAKKVSPTPYLKKTDYPYEELKRSVYFAFKSPYPDEAEKILDKIRWNFLEEEEKKHFFDFERLILYALKLLILIRWQMIKENSTQDTLKELLNL